ncbi:FliA/WhiG family RNA polymerase sigma factor [Magnetococcus sp. PR-3]|uniref:FliA/WhiG family RNA polymerase sigma factor n=1 Tax=Magnetococcus sp. PR-3 TaxID=3120355 RepID=UPI002FCE42C9
MNMHKPDVSEATSSAELWKSLTREEIILKYAPLVRYVAGRISMKLPQSVDLDDLYQVGVMGLIDAVSKFDPDRGIKFQTYAEFRIRGAILDELRAIDWVPRQLRQNASQIQEAYNQLEAKFGRPAEDVEVADHLGITIQTFHEQIDQVRGISIVSFEDIRPNSDDEEWDVLEVLADPSVQDPVEAIGLMELRHAMADAIDSLPEKERLVVTLYYFEELTMNEIGEVLGLTESRISQLHSKAALRMRARIKRFLNRPNG